MFTKRYELFRVYGIPIRIDLSWLFIFVLVTWSLASGYFPSWFEQIAPEGEPAPPVTLWLMGTAGALGLFASVLLHELAHAVVAIRRGLAMRGITLFIFGGVAEMAAEPRRAWDEFLVAIAGPIASVLIAAACYAASLAATAAGAPVPVTGVLTYLAAVNALLVAFNMVPAFPLDGGRVLRSLLWRWKDDLRWATRISAEIGSGFGAVLIAIGVVALLGGGLLVGMWWMLLGLFLRGAAQMSYQQVLIRRALEGEPVRHFMSTDPKTVAPEQTLQEVVEDHIYRYHYQMFPVTDHGQLVGCISTRQIREVPREQWGTQHVSDVMQPCTPDNTIDPDEDAMTAIARIHAGDSSRLLVAQDHALVGVLTLKDLTRFIALKIELEEPAPASLLGGMPSRSAQSEV